MNYEALMILAVETGDPLFIYDAWLSVAQTKDISIMIPIHSKYSNLINQSVMQLSNEDLRDKEVDPEELLFTILNGMEEK